jgi:hypothetical protein
MSGTVGRWTVDDDTRAWIAANVAAAPPLTPEQRTRLAELLAPVRRQPTAVREKPPERRKRRHSNRVAASPKSTGSGHMQDSARVGGDR